MSLCHTAGLDYLGHLGEEFECHFPEVGEAIKIIFETKLANKLNDIVSISPKDGRHGGEYLPTRSKWTLERTFIHYNYNSQIKSEQIVKVIKYLEEYKITE